MENRNIKSRSAYQALNAIVLELLKRSISALGLIRSSIWKYVNGEWKATFHQGTPVKTV